MGLDVREQSGLFGAVQVQGFGEAGSEEPRELSTSVGRGQQWLQFCDDAGGLATDGCKFRLDRCLVIGRGGRRLHEIPSMLGDSKVESAPCLAELFNANRNRRIPFADG